MKLSITREIEAEQWLGKDHPLPVGCHLTVPEVHWSQGRKYAYFSFAELHPHHWLGVEKLKERPPSSGDGSLHSPLFEPGCLGITLPDGVEYFREVLGFSIWNVKSEASATRNHAAVYLDENNDTMLEAFIDYVKLEGHGDNPSAEAWRAYPFERAEFRDRDGSYGRGYRPIYLKPGDWLTRETVPEGHDNLGTRELVRVFTGDELKKLSVLPQVYPVEF